MDQNKLKKQLFQELKGLGLHDELKKQIRVQICDKLKARDLVRKDQSHDDKLYNRIMASLLSEQLDINDLGFTNSVFSAESGYEGKILDRAEMLEILNMCEEDIDEKHSILSNLLKRKYPFNGNTVRSVTVQTSPEEIGYTLEQRLALIDQEFRKNVSDSGPKDTTEFKIKFERLEAEMKRAYERDMERFRQFQAHSIKVSMSQQWTKKFQDYSKNVEETYARKMETLRKRQRMLEEDLISRNKVFDEKIAGTTKILRQKIDLLDIKNSTVDETHKNLQIERKRAKEEFEAAQRELKKKIQEHDSLLLNLNKKIEYEVGIAKLAIQEEYQNKQSDFLSRKKFIDEEYGKLMGIKQSCDIIQEENKRLFDENARLRKDLTTIQQQLRVSISQNGSKGDRIQNLKGEINELKESRKKVGRQLDEESKKRKRNEKVVLELRKQVEQLRQWKQRNQESPSSESSQIMNENTNFNTDLGRKLQNLKQERKKEIEKLRLNFQ